MVDEAQQAGYRPDAEIVVRGEHMTEADPEIAYVTTELSARARRREDVFERLKERAEWQRGVIERFKDQIEREEVADHHVHPLIDRAASDAPVGFAGEIRTRILIRDLTCAGDLVSALSLGDGSDVVALTWGLRPASPVLRATRVAAVHDALSKARDYCAAVGSQLTALVSLSEATGTGRPEPTPAIRLVQHPDHAPGALFDFRPMPQVVRSVVEAQFTILQPKFG